MERLVCLSPSARGSQASTARTTHMLALLCGAVVDAFPYAESGALHAMSLTQKDDVVSDVAHAVGEQEPDPRWVQEKLMLPRINVAVDGAKCGQMQLASESRARSLQICQEYGIRLSRTRASCGARRKCYRLAYLLRRRSGKGFRMAREPTESWCRVRLTGSLVAK